MSPELNSGEEINQKDKIVAKATKPTIKEGNDIRTVVYDYNENMKVSYTPNDFGIKEEFILEKYTGNNVFTSNIIAEGFKLRLTSDNKIEVIDKKTGEIQGVMPQPYVYDSAIMANTTYEAYYELEYLGDDKYRIIVEVDKEFLENKNTTYPVYVDPSYNRQNKYHYSSYVLSKGQYAGWNFGGNNSMVAGYLSSQGIGRTYAEVEYPVNDNEVLISATYWAYAKGDGCHTSSGYIDLYAAKGDWNVQNIRYNNQPGYGKYIDAVYFSTREYGWEWYDLTELATDHMLGRYGAYGFVLKARDEKTTYRNFASENYAGYKPYVKYVVASMDKAPSVKAYGNEINSATGYLDISWDAVPGAAGYYVAMFNGANYEYIDVGNVTSYSTKGKGIWPTPTEIENGRRTLHTSDKKGGELANNPALLYNTQKDTKYKDWQIYWVRICAYNKYGMVSRYSPETCPTLPDRTAPALVPSLKGKVTNPGVNGGDKGIIDLQFTKPVDYPVDKGIARYALEVRERGINTTENQWGNYKLVTDKISGSATSYKITDLPDGRVYQYRIKAFDSSGNYSGYTYSDQFIIKDATAPNGPNVLKYNTEYTSGNTFDVEFDDIRDSSTIKSVEFKLPGGEYKDYNKKSGKVTLDTSSLKSGVHAVYLKVTDSFGNYSTKKITYKKDISAPELVLEPEGLKNGQAFAGIMNIKTSVLDSHSGVKKWELSYTDNLGKKIIKSGTDKANENISFDTSNLDNDKTYNIVLYAEDNLGNNIQKEFKFIKSTMIENVDKGTNLKIPEKISNTSPTIEYDKTLKSNLYTYDIGNDRVLLKSKCSKAGDILTFNPLEFKDGESFYGYISAVKDGNILYSKDAYKKELFKTQFDTETTGIVKKENLDMANGIIKNKDEKLDGIITTKKYSLDYHVDALKIDMPNSKGKVEVWIKDSIEKKDILLESEDGIYRLPNPQKDIELLFKLKSGTTASELDSLNVTAYGAMKKDMASGSLFTVKLVEEPTKQSAVPNIDYMTKISWDPSETDGVKYNIYRDVTPNFEISEDKLIGKEIDGLTFKDYNLNYGKKFYYKVTAVKDYSGVKRESIGSNEVFAKIIDKDEVDKKVGIQANYEFVSFRTADGSGSLNVDNQNLVYQAKDFVMNSPCLAMVLTRTYNSVSSTKSIFGYNTDLSFNTSILKEFDDNNNEVAVLLKDGDGTIHRFTKNSDGTYTRPNGIFMDLIYDAKSETYRINRYDKISYIFDKQMRLVKFTEPNGNYLEIKYNDRGNIDKVLNNIGDNITFTYNEKGLVDKATTSMGQEVYYEYSDNEVLTEVTTYVDNVKDEAHKITVNYKYGANNELIEITDPEKQVTSVQYDTGNKVNKVIYPNKEFMSLSKSNNVVTVKDDKDKKITYKLNSDGMVQEEIDQLGKSTFYEYNKDYQTLKSWVLKGTTKLITTYEYDSKGNITKIIDAKGNVAEFKDYDSMGNPGTTILPLDSTRKVTTKNEYDDKGNLIKEYDPLNRVTTYEYDKLGQLTKSIDIYGNVTTYTYDSKGRLLKVIDPLNQVNEYMEYDKYNNPIKLKNSKGLISTAEYNSLGNQVKYTNEIGETVESTYDKNSNLILSVDSRGRETKYDYDEMDRLIKILHPDGAVETAKYEYDEKTKNEIATSIDADGVETKQFYDDIGRIYKVTVGGKLQVENKFDELGNLVEVKDALGRKAISEYDDLGRQTKVINDPEGLKMGITYEYNAAGAIISQTPTAGGKTEYEYDLLGRVTKVIDYIGKDKNITEYKYEEIEGDLIKNTVIDCLGRKNETFMNKQGLVVKEVQYGDAEGKIKEETKHEYYKDGQPKKIIRNDNTVQEFTYDNYGNITKTEYKNAKGEVEDKSIFTYDKFNRLSETESYSQGETIKSSYSYDLVDRVYQEVQGNQAIKYEYTPGDQLKEISYPDLSQPDKEQNIVYNYDNQGRVDSVFLNERKVAETKFGENGQIDKSIYYSKFDTSGKEFLEIAYAYNGAGLPTDVEYKKNGTDIKEKYSFTYDSRGYISKEVAVNKHDEKKEETVTKEYTYDDIGRLLTSKNNGKETKYEYDKVGNKTKEIVTEQDKTNTLTFDYDGFNRILKSYKNGSVDTEYTYDKRGNTTRQQQKIITDDGKSQESDSTYKFNLRNELIEAKVKSGNNESTTKNYYDVDGKRVKKDENGQVANYIYYKDAVLYSTDANGNKATENVIDENGKIIATKRFDGEFENKYFTYTYDPRGSVTSILDPDLNRVKGYGYDEFGNTKEVGSKSFKNEVKFTGAIHDEQSGLYYMNSRHYNPTSGRFLSQDTFSGDELSPWTQNLYSYAGNNPVNYVDPTGHWLETLFDVACLASSVYDFIKEPSWTNAACVVLDAVAVAAPFVPAGASKVLKAASTASKWINRGVDAVRGVKAVSKVVSAGKKVYKAAKTVYNAGKKVYSAGKKIYIAGKSYVKGSAAAKKAAAVAKAAREYKEKQVKLIKLAKAQDGIVCKVKTFVTGVPNCFTAGTEIKTEYGDKPIEKTKVGDRVLAKNTDTGQVSYKKVTKLFENKTNTVVKLEIGKEKIETTKEHPFYVKGKAWMNASELREDDEVILDDGGVARVKSVVVEEYDEPVTIYNFEVEDWHTYYVSDIGVLVHNMCAKKTDDVIPWSSKVVASAAKELERGATSVYVNNKSQAQELFLGLFQGKGYRNATGTDGVGTKQLFGRKTKTYHWDDELGPDGRVLGHGINNKDGEMPHLQIQNKKIIRIFFNK